MDAIAALTSAILRPLPDRWRLPGQAALLAEAQPDDVHWCAAAVKRAIGGIARLDRIYVATRFPRPGPGRSCAGCCGKRPRPGGEGDLAGLEDPLALQAVLDAAKER